MALIGCVYCDCIEKGLLRIPHPLPHLLKVDEIGGSYCDSPVVQDTEAHREWWESRPCAHQDFRLAGGQIGNLFLVERVRKLVEHFFPEAKAALPLFWQLINRPITIPLSLNEPIVLRGPDVHSLRRELDSAVLPNEADPDDRITFNNFINQVKALVNASL